MSEFREKLVALGRGQATVTDVDEALRAHMDAAPEKASEAQQLLAAALRAGMPESVYENLSKRIPTSDDADETLFSGADWAKTDVPMADDSVDATEMDVGDATIMSNTDAVGADATVMRDASSADDVGSEAGKDLHIPGVSVAHDNDATQFSSSPIYTNDAAAPADQGGDETIMSMAPAGASANDDSTIMHSRSADSDDNATPFNAAAGQEGGHTGLDLDGDKTLISTGTIDDAFDILSDDSLHAAEASQQLSTDGNWTEQQRPASDIEFRKGSLLRNRFILETKLGEGGMGAVWKGIDKLKQEARDRNPYVAIKLLQGDFKDHPEAFIALQRETSKQQRLAHPNIATVYDFDRDDTSGTVFMTMEVLGGMDLAAHIRKKVPRDGLEYEEAMKLIRQLASGLAHAHAHDLVHSDLKPGNCFVTVEGVVKLLDFGIARASSTKDTAEGEKTLFDPGELGALTPAYAAIEMFDGAAPDPRDDIYAMAVIAYQLFTGKHPYGKKNAPKAEAGGLTVPPIAKLTKAQNRTLAQGLAFRRKNRTESVEALLEGLEPKKSQAWRWGSAAAVILALGVAIGGPLVNDYVDKQAREELIIRMADPAQTEAAFNEAARLPDEQQRQLVFADERTREVVVSLFSSKDETKINLARELARKEESLKVAIESNRAVQESVIEFYRGRAIAYFLPSATKYDFPKAKAEITKLLAIYGELKSTNDVAREFEVARTDLMAQQQKALLGHIDAGRLIDVPDVDDVFDTRKIITQVDPQSSLLANKLLPVKAAELVNLAIQEADYQRANELLKGGAVYAPNDSTLANLRDKVNRELERQKNEILVAEIEARLKASKQSFTSLTAFQEVFTDLIRLADLAPESPVLVDFQDRLTDAFGTALEQEIAGQTWIQAEALLLSFAKLFPLDYLGSQRALLSKAERASNYQVPLDAERKAAIEQRQQAVRTLLANPKADSEWEIALQVPFKELIALLPAGDPSVEPVRKQIADQYIARAETARSRLLTAQAKSVVERGETFYPAYPGFIDILARIAQTDAVLAKKAAEDARVANVDRFRDNVLSTANKNEISAAEKALGQLTNIATEAEAAKVTEAQSALAAAFGRLSELTSNKQQWGQAIKLVDRGLELDPNNIALTDVRKTYDVEYQKVREVELLKEALQANATINATELQRRAERVKTAFPEQYTSRYRDEFVTLAMTRFTGVVAIQHLADLKNAAREVDAVKQVFGEDNAKRARAILDKRMAARAKQLEGKTALAYQKEGIRIVPDATQLRGISIVFASDEAKEGIRLAKVGQLTAAATLLQSVRANEPKASNLNELTTLVNNGKRKAQALFVRFDKLAKRRRASQGKRFLVAAIDIWKDNPDYPKILDGIPTPASRYACTAEKAGRGARNRSTCHDTIGRAKGPIMVVVPAGGGSGSPFAISKLEISVADYNLYCRANSCSALDVDGKLPATGVSVKDMENYAKWLSAQSGKTYRLPNVSEWEHAANAGGQQPKRRNYNCTVMLNNRKMKGQSLRTALSGQSNGWGLINYIGNAKELVRSGAGFVARGGGYTEPLGRCRISLSEQHSGGADAVTGFRLVRELG
jgi:serine/threonine protein kinase